MQLLRTMVESSVRDAEGEPDYFHVIGDKIFPALKRPNCLKVSTKKGKTISCQQQIETIFPQYRDCLDKIKWNKLQGHETQVPGCDFLIGSRALITYRDNGDFDSIRSICHEFGHAVSYLQSENINDFESEAWAFAFEEYAALACLDPEELSQWRKFQKAHEILNRWFLHLELDILGSIPKDPRFVGGILHRLRETLYTCPGYQMVYVLAHARAAQLYKALF